MVDSSWIIVRENSIILKKKMVHRYQGFAMIYEPLTMNFFL